MFAQAVAEYGAIASIVAGVQHLASSTQLWIEDHVTESLILAGVIVLLGLAFFRVRSSRL